jgi:sulfite exporter TauE/SafE
MERGAVLLVGASSDPSTACCSLERRGGSAPSSSSSCLLRQLSRRDRHGDADRERQHLQKDASGRIYSPHRSAGTIGPIKVRLHRSRLYISAIPTFLIGVAVGVLAAVMGVGGGFIMVPAMIYLLRMPTGLV